MGTYIEFFECPVNFLLSESHCILELVFSDGSLVKTSNSALGEFR